MFTNIVELNGKTLEKDSLFKVDHFIQRSELIFNTRCSLEELLEHLKSKWEVIHPTLNNTEDDDPPIPAVIWRIKIKCNNQIPAAEIDAFLQEKFPWANCLENSSVMYVNKIE